MNTITELGEKELLQINGGGGDDYGFTSCSTK